MVYHPFYYASDYLFFVVMPIDTLITVENIGGPIYDREYKIFASEKSNREGSS